MQLPGDGHSYVLSSYFYGNGGQVSGPEFKSNSSTVAIDESEIRNFPVV